MATTNDERKVALISGITGQDGSYLTELLLKKGYTVHGIIRRSSSFNTGRLSHLYEDPHNRDVKMHLHYGDLTDSTNLMGIISQLTSHSQVKPTEIYNLAAQSHVKVSFELPEYTANVDGMGTLRLLDAVKSCGQVDTVRFYQASTSELYGLVQETPQRESTPFYPRSPYAAAKLFSYWTVVNYREAYQYHASNGILFNHESPRRGPTFVTRKVTRHVARVGAGLTTEPLYLGNVNSKRDWGHAADYVRAMWLMLQQDKPDDYVVATGETYSVKEFVEKAYSCIGMQVAWQGEGLDEVAVDRAGVVRVRVDRRYFRPTEVDLLLGDASKARERLGWVPTVSFTELVRDMVEHDTALCKAGDLTS